MNTTPADTLIPRGEFYLCLARAFLRPGPGSLAALRDDLPADLAELAAANGYELAEPLARLQAALAALADDDALLGTYSRLFLQQPIAVPINGGFYLDGAIMGDSVLGLEKLYRECGLERAEDMHDLSDHVAVQLEFTAYLYGVAAAANQPPPALSAPEFLGRHVAHWVPPFVAQLRQAHSDPEIQMPANPWLPLAEILLAGVAADAVFPEQDQDPAATRLQQARRNLAARGGQISAREMENIRRKLAERGLSTDHLDVPPDARDAERGWNPKAEIAPRRYGK